VLHRACSLCLQVHSEDEIRRILPLARKHGVPVTFRAAGTSLSGQAITDRRALAFPPPHVPALPQPLPAARRLSWR
jgi:hypothetical protein